MSTMTVMPGVDSLDRQGQQYWWSSFITLTELSCVEVQQRMSEVEIRLGMLFGDSGNSGWGVREGVWRELLIGEWDTLVETVLSLDEVGSELRECNPLTGLVEPGVRQERMMTEFLEWRRSL